MDISHAPSQGGAEWGLAAGLAGSCGETVRDVTILFWRHGDTQDDESHAHQAYSRRQLLLGVCIFKVNLIIKFKT